MRHTNGADTVTHQINAKIQTDQFHLTVPNKVRPSAPVARRHLKQAPTLCKRGRYSLSPQQKTLLQQKKNEGSLRADEGPHDGGPRRSHVVDHIEMVLRRFDCRRDGAFFAPGFA